MKRIALGLLLGWLLCTLVHKAGRRAVCVTVASIDGDTSRLYFTTEDSLYIKSNYNTSAEALEWSTITVFNNYSPVRWWTTEKRNK